MRMLLLPLVVGCLAPALCAQEAAETRPVEYGAVDWGRDLEAARTAARKDGRPILLLFQEVPG